MILKADIPKKYDISKENLYYHWKKGTFESIVKTKRKNKKKLIYVDDDSKIFKRWLKEYDIKIKGDLIEPPELSDLEKRANDAEFHVKIANAKLKEVRLEREKQDLLKARGELVDKRTSEFLYSGHMEKMNIEVFKIGNKLEKHLSKELSSLIDEKLLQELLIGFIKVFNNEVKVVVKDVHLRQKKGLEKWLKEN